MTHPIRILRVTGILEGISFLVLLLVAMPLKYYAGLPLAVKIAGWLHGFLFIAYVVVVFLSIKPMRWNIRDVFIALVASLLPFGTFVLDRSWKQKEKEAVRI